MCGIIGILCKQNSKVTIEEAVDALKRLEYRGYDSWGYAFLEENKIKLEKRVGKIGKPNIISSTTVAILHTRWATHGEVTESNAHPHLDCKRKIAIVHNGIIENYLELKKKLEEKGHKFSSQTDSEIIAHLFESECGSLYERAKKIAQLLKGSFALLAINAENDSEIVAIKHESPLCIGLSEKVLFFASDPIAFLNKTTEVIYLDEGEVAYATLENGTFEIEFYDSIKKCERKKESKKLSWSGFDSELRGYPHYMLKEILEQPKTMLNGMDLDAAQKFAEKLKGRKVAAIACGTAWHAGIIGKHILSHIANFQIDVMMAHEFHYFIEDLDKDVILLAISQSGETADVMECVRKAKQRGITVYSIVNVPFSTLARESEMVFYINCGQEIAVASTKALTNQILAFYLIAYALAGKTIDAKTEIINIANLLEKKIDYFDKKAQEVAELLKTKQHVYIIGRGLNFPIALEGALKLKEVSYIHTEGMPAGELKHGTLALIENGTPVILLCPSDYTYYDSINNGLEIKTRGAIVIGISDRLHQLFNIWIELPTLENTIFYPFFEIVVLQLIAYHTAVALGRDIDKPRNLAKSVTVK